MAGPGGFLCQWCVCYTGLQYSDVFTLLQNLNDVLLQAVLDMFTIQAQSNMFNYYRILMMCLLQAVGDVLYTLLHYYRNMYFYERVLISVSKVFRHLENNQP